jgi:hypothetical protein
MKGRMGLCRRSVGVGINLDTDFHGLHGFFIFY